MGADERLPACRVLFPAVHAMNDRKDVIRQSETRKYLGFLLFILVGSAALIAQGIVADVRGIRIEWLLLVVVYVGVYKSPGTGVLITLILGLLLDLYSGAVFGEGLFCAFFVMGYARLVSRMVYVDRIPLLFLAALATMLSLYCVLAVITLLWGKAVGTFGSFAVMSCLSAFLTALAGVILLPILKFIDPERGGYYLTRFMREEWGEPLV
jgi:rod shape-determining protein MreD